MTMSKLKFVDDFTHIPKLHICDLCGSPLPKDFLALETSDEVVHSICLDCIWNTLKAGYAHYKALSEFNINRGRISDDDNPELVDSLIKKIEEFIELNEKRRQQFENAVDK